MASNELNYQVFTYVDENGTTWNKRGELDTAVNAIDGSAALTAGAPMWPRRSRLRHTREAVFQDPTTFRTKRIIVYTAAAFTALTGSSTLAVNVPGLATTVTYNLIEKLGEKQPIAHATRQLADHP